MRAPAATPLVCGGPILLPVQQWVQSAVRELKRTPLGGATRRYPSNRMSDRGPTIVLTGATSGIGLAAARLFARDAGCLILHGRQPLEKLAPFLDQLRLTLSPQAQLHYVSADFSELAAVRRLADDIGGLTDRIDILINNAGRAGPSRRTMTTDNHEITLQVNYLAPVALTNALFPLLGTSAPGRIVNVASTTHYSVSLDVDDLNLGTHRYDAYESYAHSKLAMVTWSCWLAAHRPNRNIDVVSMHPGVIATKILGAMFGGRGDRPEVGAEHVRHVATRSGDNGTYYDKRRPVAPNPEASDPRNQAKLHERTAALLR